jgi:methyl-accepting chemotaxis protein
MNTLNNLKLFTRLALSHSVITLLAIGIAGIAWWGTDAINHAMDASLEQVQRVRAAEKIADDLDEIYINIWNLISHTEPEEKREHKVALEKVREDMLKKLEGLKASAKVQPGVRLIGELETAITAAREVNNRVIELSLRGEELAARNLFVKEGGANKERIDQTVHAYVAYREERLTAMDQETEALVEKVKQSIVVASVFAVLLAAGFGLLVTRSISGPIGATVTLLDHISQGDLSHDVPEALRDRRDEAGDLGRSLQTMTGNMRTLVRDLTGGVETLASSATELSAVSAQTSNAVKSMSEKSSTVAAAAEEASANTTSVAASMEQAATNLASVASATEEMSATVGEIASNSEKARAISEQATAQAQTISRLMQELGRAAQEIGKVTETITDISSQTNLLALNATIEAARAGAAGKGFAVVANEIKELARQTAAATEDIKVKIAGVQSSAGSAIADIEQISGVIKEVNAIVSSIAASIEEQAVVTKDVAGNISQASAGVKDSNERIAQTAEVSKSIARDMTGVNDAVGEIRQGGEQVEASTAELSKLAEQLKATAGQFKV